MALKKIFTLALFLFSGSVFGQNTLLWKVTKPGSKHVSYLLGTHHMFGESFVDSFPSIKKAIISSKFIITETRIDRDSIAGYYNKRSSSDSIFHILPATDIDFITQILNEKKIDISKFSPGELFLRLQMNYPKYKCSILNAADKFVMDEYVQFLGNQYKKKLFYLEPASLQLDMIREFTKEIDWKFFKKRGSSLLAKYRADTTDENQCLFANQYASFSVDYKLDDTCKISGMNEKLINKRNAEWMMKIPEFVKKGNSFIALGQAHFYNKCGIIEQLRRIGYIVEQVDMNSVK